MQKSESIARLTSLGLMNPLVAIETIIEAVPASELGALRPKVNAILTERFIAVKRTVKRTQVAEIGAWHLQRGDREIIAQNQSARRAWRVYEVKRAKNGELKKGRLLEARMSIDCLNDVVWDLATGKY